jgi:hypothetical protein
MTFTTPSPRYLNRKQAAQYCGMSCPSFDANVRPHVQVIHLTSRPLWDVQDLESFLESQKATLEPPE